MATFSATVDKWISDSEEKMEAVFKTAVQFTIDEALDRTPVDTGFLKSSMTVSLSGFAPLRDKGFSLNNTAYELVIAGADLGDTIYANYVANYAQHVENGSRGRAGRHMVKLAAQRWQSHINRAVSLVS
jgi:hypothetical protein